jgi:hypothetical protein
MRISSYPSIYNVGHKALEGFFDGEIVIQEKVDGSQISFGVFDGALCMRSKGVELFSGQNGMFQAGMDVIDRIAHQLIPNATYRGEYLRKPKHNTIVYGRVPLNNIILFDVDLGDQDYVPAIEIAEEAMRLGLEAVPVLYTGTIDSWERLKVLLDTDSCLENAKIEGFVAKNYKLFGSDKKVLMAKYVSEAFKEKHSKEWKEANPKSKNVVETLIEELAVTTRWNKSLQHLRDDGQLEESPRDIGKLIAAISKDVHDDEEEYIKERLFKAFWKEISRGVTRGFPEWYKEQLAATAFEE